MNDDIFTNQAPSVGMCFVNNRVVIIHKTGGYPLESLSFNAFAHETLCRPPVSQGFCELSGRDYSQTGVLTEEPIL